LNRRTFLKISSLSGTGFWLNPVFNCQALAKGLVSANVEGAFVLIVVKDGMDVTLGLDPWIKLPAGIDDKDIFIEYAPDQVSSPAKGFLLGPAAKALGPFAQDIAIINGVFQNDIDNGHDANLSYIKTGNGAGLAPSASVATTDYFGRTPLGLLVLDSSPVFASKKVSVTSVRDITSWVLGSDFSSIVKSRAKEKTNQMTDLMLSQQAVLELGPYRKQMLARIEKSRKSLSSNKDEVQTLLACLGSGAARVAEIEIRPANDNLDTHSDHVGRHLAGQKDVWNQIAELFKLSKSVPFKNSASSVFDKTTFVVVSDFARTPYLNSNNGKDHNPNTNSVLIAGRGVRGGQVIGKSHIISRKKSPKQQSIHTGFPLDYKTLLTVEDRTRAGSEVVDFIYPENVMATVYQCAGLPLDSMGPIKASTRILRKLIKT
jgi:uncharacterized protein (DUF1501 family)